MYYHVSTTTIKKLNISITPKSCISPFRVNPIPQPSPCNFNGVLQYVLIVSFFPLHSIMLLVAIQVSAVSVVFFIIIEWYSIV